MTALNQSRKTRQPPKPGTARAALGYRDFRIIWTANFLSSIGTWMQNVVLPAYVYQRTQSAASVGIFIFAQLGPQDAVGQLVRPDQVKLARSACDAFSLF